MSRRGGDRRPDSHRDQPPPSSASPAIHRVGGFSGRGRGRAGPFPVTSQPPPPSEVRASTPLTPQASASTTTAEPPPAASLSRDVEQRLTMLEKAPPLPPSPSSKTLSLPVRPGFGRVGRKCVVRANHFLVDVADKDLCHYDVSITPHVNRNVMRQLVEMFRTSHFGTRCPAYDGWKSLYTAGQLPFESKDFFVKLVETDGQANRRERDFKVTIKFAGKPDLHHLREFLRSRQLDCPRETIQVLDVVLRGKPSKNYVTVGRSFFHPSLGPKGELGDGIEFWKGYYQSLRPTQMGLSLNIDVSARAFFEPIPVTDFVIKHFNLRDPSTPLSEHERLKVKKALKGIKVESIHLGHAKIYKISGISMEPINRLIDVGPCMRQVDQLAHQPLILTYIHGFSLLTISEFLVWIDRRFTLDDNRTQVSVAQYFRDKYRIQLKYVSWPAIQAGSSTKSVFLPMEVCKIVEGQRYSKKLNETQVTNLLRATCQRPVQREETINNIVVKNKHNSGDLVDEFGIEVKEQMAVVDARILPPPTLLYHGSGKNSTENPRMGQWNMIDKKMVNGGRVDFWACVNFSRWNSEMQHCFCEELVTMCNAKGMVFHPRPVLPISSAPASQIERALFDVHEQSGQKLQLLIVILPEVTGSYGRIKRVCETELGIVSQCCQPRKAAKLSKQYLENVALKINVKVGGRNTVLSDAIQRRIPLVSDVPTIIFGADVTHPQPGEDSTPSIAAVVASMDWPEVTKYKGLVSAQVHREEIIQDLYKQVPNSQKGLSHGGMIREHMISFLRSTWQKPKRIILYREGVSEGQFSQVLLYEIDAIRKACASLEEGYLPPITFVVVQKRHHTRLFPTDTRNHDNTDKSGNIAPGTVVDTHVCHPTEFDFYLNSHAVTQGTSRPTHYHVLFDENRFTADALQVLTNNLCYTFARCTRSVSIVPPVYYAHLIAFRARYYIEGDSSDGASSSSGTRSRAGGGGGNEVRALPLIKDNVKAVMFYC